MRLFSILKGMKGIKKLWNLYVGDHGASEEAKKRVKIIEFYDKHGLVATKDAFMISRPTIYR